MDMIRENEPANLIIDDKTIENALVTEDGNVKVELRLLKKVIPQKVFEYFEDLHGKNSFVSIDDLSKRWCVQDTVSTWRDKNKTINVYINVKMRNTPVKITRAGDHMYFDFFINFNTSIVDKDLTANETVKEYVKKGFHAWNGVFDIEGQDVTLISTLHEKGKDTFKDSQQWFDVKIVNTDHIEQYDVKTRVNHFISKGNSNTVVFFGWAISKNTNDMYVYWDKSRSEAIIINEATHELGHRLGIDHPDDNVSKARINGYRYDIWGSNTPPNIKDYATKDEWLKAIKYDVNNPDVMRPVSGNSAVSSYDVAAAWNAFFTHQFRKN